MDSVPIHVSWEILVQGMQNVLVITTELPVDVPKDLKEIHSTNVNELSVNQILTVQIRECVYIDDA